MMSRVWVDKSVASADNQVFRSLVDCLTTKGVKKHGLFFASGEKAITDLIEKFPDRVRDLVVCTELHLDVTARDPKPKLNSVEALISSVRARAPKASVLAFTKPLFDQLDTFGTHQPLLVLSAWDIPEADLKQEPQGLEILCALSDPSNLGALLRSATAFGASKVILLKESASPFHARAVRAASACTFAIPLEKGPSISHVPEFARQIQSPTLALDMEGAALPELAWPQNLRLLLGEEGRGIPGHEGDLKRIVIPIAGVESLNATVAASVALYSYRVAYPRR
jgi:TrmH family RNA methyltransferase